MTVSFHNACVVVVGIPDLGFDQPAGLGELRGPIRVFGGGAL
jgi:hypothetical protein